jgi:hypothetical protein
VGFGSKTVNVAVFKPVSSVANAAAAYQWSVSYQTVVARTLRQFAGSHHLVDPRWLAWVNEALDKLPPGSEIRGPGRQESLGDPTRAVAVVPGLLPDEQLRRAGIGVARAGAASRPPVSADGVDLTGASDGREHVSLT